MNISKQNIDDVNAVITVNIEKTDYTDRVDNVLKDYRKKANMPGFRPGKVPASLVKKMYGRSVLLDEVNKLMGEELSKFLEESDFDILGEPLPSENQDPIDLENGENFEFKFDVALSPAFEVSLSKREKIKNYIVKVEDEMVERQINSYTDRFGEQSDAEVVEVEDLLKGTLVELNENGEIKDGGIMVEKAIVSPDRIKDEDIRNSFVGAKMETVVPFNPMKAFVNPKEVASLLKVDEDNESVNSNYNYIVTEIKRFKKAEVNKELFDKVYGEGVVETEEDFRAKIKEEVQENFKTDSEFRFLLDTREKLLKKVEDLVMPETFLKKWLIEKNRENKEFSEEQLETEFPKVMENLKWDLIKGKLAKDNDIQTTQEDVTAYAKKMAKMQFMQYGMANVPDEHLESYAQEILKNQDQARNAFEKSLEEKIVGYVKEHVKVEDEEISLEDFNKLFEKN